MMRRAPELLVALSMVLAIPAAFAHGGEDHGTEPVAPLNSRGEGPQRLADGSLFMPKPVQRQLALRTQPVRITEQDAIVELNGTVIPDPQTGGRVQAPVVGSVMPGPKGMPVAGRMVTKGEVLAYLRPVSGTIERSNQQAALAELEAQHALVDRRVKRLEQLEGAIPQKEIEAARIERAALIKRRTFVQASIDHAEPLRAPVGGVISASHHLLAGQMVDAKELLFEIVDPNRLAVEALAYEARLASTVLSASTLTGQTALDLQFVGGGRQLREQALPLLFRITTPRPDVAVGQPVQVMVRTASRTRGAAVPRSAVTQIGSGDTVVWVHTDAERFVARKVRVQSLDATRVTIRDGMHEGDRVVVTGAGLLSQVR